MKFQALFAGLVVMVAFSANAVEVQLPVGTSKLSLKDAQSTQPVWNAATEIEAIKADTTILEKEMEVAQTQQQISQVMYLTNVQPEHLGTSPVVNFGALQDIADLQRFELENKREKLVGEANLKRRLSNPDRTSF